ATDIDKAAFINNKSWSYFEKKGDLLTGEITPASGSLNVNIYLKYNGKTSYWGLLEYNVK
ncbi:MAG: hypothetical protein KAS39_06755, partial [Actinomycetia bacterium]|nr:hypothetical protein [Actinomycetes bacterium]